MRTLLFLTLLSLLAGCGEQLVDKDYMGEPLVEIEGQVFVDQGFLYEFEGAELRVTIFWTGTKLSNDPLQGEAALQHPSISAGDFPAHYTFAIYQAPDFDELKHNSPDFIIGFILLFLDRNDNGLWDAEVEPLAGGNGDLVIVYAPEKTYFSGTYEREEIPEGFSLMNLYQDMELCEESEKRFDLFHAEEETLNLYLSADIELIIPSECYDIYDICPFFEEEEEAIIILMEFWFCVFSFYPPDDVPADICTQYLEFLDEHGIPESELEHFEPGGMLVEAYRSCAQ